MMKPTDTTLNNEQTNNCKIIIDQSIPIEELLGSVTAYNNVEGSECKSQQLRTSARVFKKMKLDSAASMAAASTVAPEKKEPVKEEVKPEVKKFRPLWSPEDKNLFFEALNEYGKDFEAIHLYISNKLKKKGLPESVIKSKDQVRHLYYRTWHKISKHLKFSDDIKKIAQELYSLINYGELRKKLGFVTEKTCVRLNELIYRGYVNIRVKGKTIRIRTPMCRALRKLNQLDEKHDDLKLPTRVTVELRPKDNNTFMRIQEIAQNPRVKTAIILQKRLSSLINYLTERWKSKNAKDYEKTIDSSNNLVSECLEEKSISESKAILEPQFRVAPPGNASITIPTVNLSEFLTSQSICLNAYEERLGVKVPGEQLVQHLFSSSSKGTSKKGTKRPRNESISEKLVSLNSKPASLTPTLIDNAGNASEVDTSKVNEVVDFTVNTILALNQSQEQNGQEEEKKIESTEVKKMEVEDVEELNKEKIEKIKQGWTLNDCGNLAIGDLYLMFGSDAKLTLEYSWDPPEVKPIKKESDECLEEERNEDFEIPESLNTSASLSTVLQRLLSVAKLHYRKNIIKCPCGHVCGNSNKNIRKPKTTLTKMKPNENAQESSETISDNVTIAVNNSPPRVPVYPVLIQSQLRKISPSLFRRPNSPNTAALHAQLASISRLKPKYCNRRGRLRRSQQVVVERKLPLLANKADRDSGRQIVQMNIISPNNIKPAMRPIAPKIVKVSTDESIPGEVNQTLVTTEYVDGTLSTVDMNVTNTTTFSIVTSCQTNANTNEQLTLVGNSIHINDNAITPSRAGSPTSISNLLDIALSSSSNHENNDIVLNNVASDNKEETNISFAGLLSERVVSPTPPSSPSRILKENENQWLNAEVNDFSLSSFLGHLESPLKASTSTTGIGSEDTRLCLTQDVEQHLQSLLTESSLDYSAKFADLAAEVTDIKK